MRSLELEVRARRPGRRVLRGTLGRQLRGSAPHTRGRCAAHAWTLCCTRVDSAPYTCGLCGCASGG
eukprot:2278316-Rhodomonas_salina.2